MANWNVLFDTHIADLRQRCEETRQKLDLDHAAWTQYIADRAGLGFVTIWNFRRHPNRNFTIETLRAIDRAVSSIDRGL